MKDYEPAMSFGEDVAKSFGGRGDEAEAVAFLARSAGQGPALELAIGTGRIALPLAATGIRVDGIDISPAMVAELRARPGGENISVTVGNFADVAGGGSYSLIYVVWNSFFNLQSQDEQVRCFENVAAHLTEDGVFVIEADSPSFLYHLRDYQYVDAEAVKVGEVKLDVARYDPVTQRLEESHVSLSSSGIHVNPVVTRYAWPSELDLMARLAGLQLKARWGGWSGEPYNGTSRKVVSVFGR